MDIAHLQRAPLLRNIWYVAGFSDEVGTVPLARRICNQPLVLFRTASGRAAALEDRCAHRGVPFSSGGECEGEILRCPYHGLEYDVAGVCTRVPGQDRIPPGARVRAFPLVEQDELLWIWMGDPGLAEPGRIVRRPWHTSPEWRCVKGHLEVKANWLLVADNLLNLSHLQYVHKSTIGGDPQDGLRAEVKAERQGDRVMVTRWLLDVEPPPMHRMAVGFTGKIDRWQEFEFRPGVLQFYSGAKDAGTGAYEGNREGGMHIRHFHATTPETEHSTLYFFTSARSFRIDDDELTGRMRQSMIATFSEDKIILETQQARLLESEDGTLVDIRDDAANLHARRLVAELIEQEQQLPGRPAAPEAALRNALREQRQ